jgi:dGTPase
MTPRPHLLADPDGDTGSTGDSGAERIRRLGRGRGVIDYVASLSDSQAIAVSEALSGRTDRLWDVGQSL